MPVLTRRLCAVPARDERARDAGAEATVGRSSPVARQVTCSAGVDRGAWSPCRPPTRRVRADAAAPPFRPRVESASPPVTSVARPRCPARPRYAGAVLRRGLHRRRPRWPRCSAPDQPRASYVPWASVRVSGRRPYGEGVVSLPVDRRRGRRTSSRSPSPPPRTGSPIVWGPVASPVPPESPLKPRASAPVARQSALSSRRWPSGATPPLEEEDVALGQSPTVKASVPATAPARPRPWRCRCSARSPSSGSSPSSC